MASDFTVAGLFAGIGGLELGLARGLGDRMDTALLCEWWDPAQHVLRERFPGVEIHPDVRELNSLPSDVSLVSAGFPCTDLSQAGRTAGITGQASGLVSHLFGALRQSGSTKHRPTLLIENVPNMLVLDGGRAMQYLVTELESLGYRWAYRVVDSRFTGVPQRRRRVLMVASTELDPRAVLFSDDSADPLAKSLADDAYGFYWTEGRGGLGWAQDAVPTLKGGSTIGIPSPPAVWARTATLGRRFVKPSVEDAEAMQGFARGWTDVPGIESRRDGTRWKLVGNAVTVGVAAWVGYRLGDPGEPAVAYTQRDTGKSTWPNAAWGESGRVWTAPELSEFPLSRPYRHLADVVDLDLAPVLSHRATAGFWNRLQQGNLGRFPGFREEIHAHLEFMAAV